MNNRDYKKFGIGNMVHIYNRGNNKEKIFLDKQDYKAFLFRLGLVLGLEPEEMNNEMLLLPFSRIRISSPGRNKFLLHSFCLMPNHFHLLVEQNSDIPISEFVLKLCTSYAKYFNKKYGRVGHVFQDQYKSVVLKDNTQLMWTICYIHMNPVKGKLAKNPGDYLWSSYKDFALDRDLPIISKNFVIGLFENKENLINQTFSSDVKGDL